jgi:hypothetical protein
MNNGPIPPPLNALGPKHAIGERGAETKLLDARFSKMNIGDIITDEEISKITGKPTSECYSYIMTAIKIALRRGHCIARVRKVGFKRVDSSGSSDLVHKKNIEAYRRAKRGVQIGGTVDRDKLDDSEKAAFDLRYATARLLTASAKLKTVPQISQPTIKLIGPDDLTK